MKTYLKIVEGRYDDRIIELFVKHNLDLMDFVSGHFNETEPIFTCLAIHLHVNWKNLYILNELYNMLTYNKRSIRDRIIQEQGKNAPRKKGKLPRIQLVNISTEDSSELSTKASAPSIQPNILEPATKVKRYEKINELRFSQGNSSKPNKLFVQFTHDDEDSNLDPLPDNQKGDENLNRGRLSNKRRLPSKRMLIKPSLDPERSSNLFSENRRSILDRLSVKPNQEEDRSSFVLTDNRAKKSVKLPDENEDRNSKMSGDKRDSKSNKLTGIIDLAEDHTSKPVSTQMPDSKLELLSVKSLENDEGNEDEFPAHRRISSYERKIDRIKDFQKLNCDKYSKLSEENSVIKHYLSDTHLKYKVDKHRLSTSAHPLIARSIKERELSNEVIAESKDLIEKCLKVIERNKRLMEQSPNNKVL